MTTASVSSDPELVRAILDHRLSKWAQGVLDDPTAGVDSHELATQALDTCAAIRASVESDGERLAAALRAADVEPSMTHSDQRHSLVIDVAATDAETATTVLQDADYETRRQWTGGAARSFRRSAREAIFTRSGAHSTVVRLRWRRPAPRPSKPRSAVQRIITPTPADWAMIDLPERLWWAYGVVRPFRLLAERVGLASHEHGDLEPFLVTPDALLDPLFAVAQVDATDVFADIGCGDGRIVIAAADRRGCRAIGVEQSLASATVARERVEDAALSDRIRILHADAQDVDLSSATVALFFVPMVVASRLVPTILSRLAMGGRVVLHEQSPLAASLSPPAESVAIIAADAVTVAHLWFR